MLLVDRRKLAGALATIALIAILSAMRTGALQNGDAALYNERVDTLSLGKPSTHFGYMFLGVLFRALLSGPTDVVMNWMTAIVGCLGLFAVYISTLKMTGRVFASSIAALTMLGVSAYVHGMLMSEVDVPLAATIAIAFAFWLHGHSVLTGLVFGVAMLISPLASLSLPGFLLAPDLSRSRKLELRWQLNRIAVFGVASLSIYLPIVLYNFQNYVYGGRGILHAPLTCLPFFGPAEA